MDKLLATHEWRSARMAAYDALLRATVFNQCSNTDRKEALRQRALLETPGAYEILRQIWTHGRTAANEVNAPPVLTAYALACLLAGSATADVSRLNSRIRNVAIAAHAYGLVERQPRNSKLVCLIATTQLETFMQRLAQQDIDSVETLTEALKVIRVDD